jgi:hypothetical protein
MRRSQCLLEDTTVSKYPLACRFNVELFDCIHLLKPYKPATTQMRLIVASLLYGMSPESKRKVIETHHHKPLPQAELLQMHAA